MKLSTPLFLVAAATPIMADKVIIEAELTLPEDFVVHCCVNATAVPNPFSATFNIAGWGSDACTGTDYCTENGGVVKTAYDMCDDLGGIICPDDIFNCCNPSGEGVIGDIPWTCNAHIKDPNSGEFSFVGPLMGPGGYYCGPQRQCKNDGAVCGDPHFQTWGGDWYDFHGECDMVFAKDSEFGQGLGLDINIRSKQRYEYSYIESAAIRIGDDVLQVDSYGEYFFNGVAGADLKEAKFADLYPIDYVANIKTHTHTFNITIGESDGTIQVKSFKDMVAVKMFNASPHAFGKTVGMMGDFKAGTMLSRDGKTTITDPIEFGMEWQVRAEEDMIFQSPRAPQLSAGEQCRMPSKSAQAQRRRLGEGVSEEVAQAACAAVDHVHHDNCVYDVMATGDLEAAHAGVF